MYMNIVAIILLIALLVVWGQERREYFSSTRQQCVDQGYGREWCSQIEDSMVPVCGCSGGLVAYERYGRCYCVSFNPMHNISSSYL